MEPLKEMFNRAYYQNLARVVSTVYKPFSSTAFINEVIENLEALSLNERMRHTSQVLQKHLPDKYATTIAILKNIIQQMPTGYTALVFPDFVSQFGKDDLKTSLDALKYFTQFGSSEFAIRAFLKSDFDKTLKTMYAWSEDENVHVRRLASEGSRPRLPWSFKLEAIIQKPSLTAPILENLKSDEELYVRKSVANHLNDFSKDSPEYLLRLIKPWDKTNAHTAWIIKRGCRSLLKAGNKKTMAAFGLTKNIAIDLKKFKLNTTTLRLNDELKFEFDITATKKTIQHLMIDYRIHYVKKTGAQLPKVFKLKELELKAGETVHISKKQRFQDFTTRALHSGTHILEIVVNGSVMVHKEFELVR
jgi:3-methyladenine DNA glycosylase AlkC